MSFKDFLNENEPIKTSYYADELNSLLPADESGIQFQFSSTKRKTKWMTLNDESKIALVNFLENSQNIKENSSEGKNGYIAFYKGKQLEVYANSSYEAQKKAAELFKAKKSYDVTVKLATKDGEQIEHKPLD